MNRSFDGTEIWFSDSASDGPVVILLHGVCMTSISNFEIHFGVDDAGRVAPTAGPTISSLLRDDGARVVGIDARGHGRSGRSSDPAAYRGDAHARDTMSVIDAVGADLVDVVGYSMGGLTALRLLGREHRLRSVALCGAGPVWLEGGDDRWLRECGECFQSNDFSGRPEYKPYRAYARLDPIHDFDSIGAAMIGIDWVPHPWTPVAGVAVMVLNGGDDDGDDHAARLAALIPGAVSKVAGTGNHGMAPSDPLYQDALINFLKDTWPSGATH